MLTGAWPLEGAQQKLSTLGQVAQDGGLPGVLFPPIKGCRCHDVFLMGIHGGLKFPLAQCSVTTERRNKGN